MKALQSLINWFDTTRGLAGQANTDLWVMNADGSNPHDITNTPNVTEVRPDWGTHHLTH